jgi:uncharacterized protein (DUF1697 family)
MKYAAFLRGVNVNGRKVGKDELKAVFEELGLSNVKTYLQSGNVTFDTSLEDIPKLKQLIETALQRQFGFAITTFTYPIEAIRSLIDNYPFGRRDGIHAYAVLTDGQIPSLLDKWPGSEADQVAPASLGFYWSVPQGMTLESTFAKFMASKKIAEHTTTRNLNTLEKMVAGV